MNHQFPMLPGRLALLLGILLLLSPGDHNAQRLGALKLAEAALPCQTTEQCVKTLREGSQCVDGQCTNPYHRGGCLKQRLPDWKRTRVCHSEDSPEAELLGNCVPPNPDFDYMEVRVLTHNWESAFFQTYVIQIVLSEILGIPVTLESGTKDDLVDFYHPENPLGYGLSYDYEALRRGNEVGDCRLLKESRDNANSSTYQGCAHVMPEIWYGQQKVLDELYEEGMIEKDSVMGALGYQGLNIPIFTGKKDPTLLTHLGLTGQENRAKLAKTFLRPTNWKDYCDLVSADSCVTPDSVAARPPQDEGEESRYFLEGLFKGYFRATEKNDCVKYPNNCTGHVVDYPCGWTSFLQQQLHHLDIALESDGDEPLSRGYSYAAMTEIWAAANATGSDVMMRWWTPEALYQTFLGTEAEFQRVSLRPPTDDCLKARVSMQDRCDETLDASARLGTAEGSCDEPPFSLQRIFTQSFVDMANDPTVPEGSRSPAYEAIDNIRLTGLQIGKMFDFWLKRNSDKYNFDPRDAACRWVAENFEDLIWPMVPKTFPRVIEEADLYGSALFKVSLSFSILSVACVVTSIVGTIYNRKKPAIQLAQVDFLYLLLTGLSLVSAASIILNLRPTDSTCTAISWLLIQGYTFELVPLLFKVGAIASLMAASKKFKRVKLDRRKLFTGVFAVSAAVVAFLIVWTVIDPWKQTIDIQLTEEENSQGETVVLRALYCSSDSHVWLFVSVGWHGLLLLCGTVLAVQTRKLKEHAITESLVVAILVYSHFIFMVLRLLHFYFSDRFDVWTLAPYLSLIFSCDVIAACCIYFFPKIFCEDPAKPRFQPRFPNEISLSSTSKRITTNSDRRQAPTHDSTAKGGSPASLTDSIREEGDDSSYTHLQAEIHRYRSRRNMLMDSAHAVFMSSTRSHMLGEDSSTRLSFGEDNQRKSTLSGHDPHANPEGQDSYDDNDTDQIDLNEKQEKCESGGEEFRNERFYENNDMPMSDSHSIASERAGCSVSGSLQTGAPLASSSTSNMFKRIHDRMEEELLLHRHNKDDVSMEVSV